MFEIQKRRISADSLTSKLKKLTPEKRWLYKSPQLTNDDYHSAAGVSSSILKEVANPKTTDCFVYEKYVARSLPEPVKKHFVIGRSIHSYLLEPHQFDAEYTVSDYEPPTEKQLIQNDVDIQRLKAIDENVTYWSELDMNNASNPFASLVDGLKRPTKAQVAAMEKVEPLAREIEDTGRDPTKGEQTKLDKYFDTRSTLTKFAQFDSHQRTPDEGRKRPTQNDIKFLEKRDEIRTMRAQWEQWQEGTKGKQVLSTDQMALLQHLERSARANAEISAILTDENTFTELSCFWRCHETGLIKKARADIFTPACLYDLKAMDDISPIAFARDVVKWGYHIQAAHYMEGFGVDKFKFICISKNAPYEVAIYELDEDFIECGYIQAAQATERFNDCVTRERWPSWTTAEAPVITLECPKWLAARHIGA